MIDQFLGDYGNFAYGNMTVVIDDITENIILEFDLYRCLAGVSLVAMISFIVKV